MSLGWDKCDVWAIGSSIDHVRAFQDVDGNVCLPVWSWQQQALRWAARYGKVQHAVRADSFELISGLLINAGSQVCRFVVLDLEPDRDNPDQVSAIHDVSPDRRTDLMRTNEVLRAFQWLIQKMELDDKTREKLDELATRYRGDPRDIFTRPDLVVHRIQNGWRPEPLPPYQPQLGSRHIPEAVKREVWQRDGGRCVRCGGRGRLEFDHIIAFARGGSNTARNLQLLCEMCNRRKAAREPGDG